MTNDFDIAAPTPVVSPYSAPVRGSVERPDFRKPADALDPTVVGNEAQARAQASADRRAAAIERDSQAGAATPPSADARLQALERRVQTAEADAIVMRARLTALEDKQPAKPVSRLRQRAGGPELPGAA
jgi:hypothetical protein